MPKPPHSAHPIEIIARGLLRESGAILVCRNLDEGYCYLPGGHVEFAEPAAVALAREFEEECGLNVRVGPCRLVTEGTFKTRKRVHHEINLVFHVERSASAAEPRTAVASLERHIAFEWIEPQERAALLRADLRPPAIQDWLSATVVDPAARVPWASNFLA